MGVKIHFRAAEGQSYDDFPEADGVELAGPLLNVIQEQTVAKADLSGQPQQHRNVKTFAIFPVAVVRKIEISG